MAGWIGKIFAVSGLLVVANLASPALGNAQSAPGPLQNPKVLPPPVQTGPPRTQKKSEIRESIAGNWKLNKDESDDGRRQIENASRSNRGNGRNNGNGPYGQPGCGGGVGFPSPCGPGGGYPNGGPGGPGGQGGQPNPNAMRGMDEYAFPSDFLTIVNKDPEVDLTDDHFRKRIFYTDGRAVAKSKDDQKQEIAAHWDGTRLVSDEKSPQGAKLTRTFELSSGGRELNENIHIDKERSTNAIDIRYVYEAVDHVE